jgi:cellulose synthase/poly-beta-1,6-N-acetylglucosamine synthase-like glycosyltransferase
MKIIFFGSIILIFFAYCGYPLSLYLLGLRKRRIVEKDTKIFDITMIIAAYNEEKRIKEKLQNTLELDYPQDKMQIIVTSDGSVDKTNEIVAGFQSKGIELLPLKERKGKENAQKEAVKLARGEILVFTDVATRLLPEGLKEIVFNFADRTVGCVSSVDQLIGRDGQPSGEGTYLKYEMWLRKLETEVKSLVGLSGSFFAARKEVCRDFSSEMQSDFRTVFNSIKMGLRAISDPDSIGYYQDISDGKKEFDRKVRTVLRGFTVFFQNTDLLNFYKYGLFSYQLICHKLLRWLVPGFLLVAFISNLLLISVSIWYFIIFLCQMGFYGLAALGHKQAVKSKNPFIKIPVYFITVNAAILIAWWRFLRGQRMVMWTPSER